MFFAGILKRCTATSCVFSGKYCLCKRPTADFKTGGIIHDRFSSALESHGFQLSPGTALLSREQTSFPNSCGSRVFPTP